LEQKRYTIAAVPELTQDSAGPKVLELVT